MAANAVPKVFYGIVPAKGDEVSGVIGGLAARWQPLGYRESEIGAMAREASKALEAICKAEGLEFSLSGEAPRDTPYLAVATSAIEGGSQLPKRFTLPKVGADWDERLGRACAALGIKPGGRPGWHLACRIDW